MENAMQVDRLKAGGTVDGVCAGIVDAVVGRLE